jgi:hypothetical protein
MEKRHRLALIIRLVAVFGIVGTITTGATFAALQSPGAKINDNTISSATANLQASLDGTNYPSTIFGYNFSAIVPGGASMPANGNPLYLKNAGTANLSLKVSVSSTPINPGGVDLSKVFLHITKADNSYDQAFSIKALVDNYTSGGVAMGDVINASAVSQYKLRVSMDADAFSGSTASVSISDIDLVFNGLGI